MRKIIDRKRYDTKTARNIANWDNGNMCTDFAYCDETLYCAPRGTYFIYGEGGAMSKYARRHGNMYCWGRDIKPLSRDEAIDWCQDKVQTEALEQEFGAALIDA